MQLNNHLKSALEGKCIRLVKFLFSRYHCSSFSFLILILAAFAAAPSAQAFDGPKNAPGIGPGAFSYSSSRFAIGTSTPFQDARFIIITSSSLWTSSSSPQSEYAFKVVNSPCPGGQSQCPPVFSIRNDGAVIMGGANTGTDPTYNVPFDKPPNSTYHRGLTVWGPAFVKGSMNAMDFLGGNISPTLLRSGIFDDKGFNGPFAFRGSLAIATTTKDAIPQPLSVYGSAYVSGNVGIGTTGPSHPLTTSRPLATVWYPDIRVGGYQGNDAAYIGSHNDNQLILSAGGETSDNTNTGTFATARAATAAFIT
ncbi:MAG: hypothetical protein FJY98_04000, partial [Candidatus Liptonbacteria bacterium]|nr:hypothetical protein [Candidatus Liptonbacteria bacterium]